ncbi:MAG TPA: hypothetical protein VKU01_24110 [Bryobacteraceae bacterium]|nr:hypothetical protein [Bryobacteraceae bacterium]
MRQAILKEIEAYEKNPQLTINRNNHEVASKSDVTLAQTSLADAPTERRLENCARANERASRGAISFAGAAAGYCRERTTGAAANANIGLAQTDSIQR